MKKIKIVNLLLAGSALTNYCMHYIEHKKPEAVESVMPTFSTTEKKIKPLKLYARELNTI